MSISPRGALVVSLAAVLTTALAGCAKQPEAAPSAPSAAPLVEPIPRAASTPNTPKNWAGPKQRIYAQALVDELIASHPEVASFTIHAPPPGEKDLYTMIAGSFPDRIGNMSSTGHVLAIKKAVSQVESKWGTPEWRQKVSIVLPLKDVSGTYLPAAIVIAYATSADDKRVDTDFLAPGVAIRDELNSRIETFAALFEPAR